MSLEAALAELKTTVSELVEVQKQVLDNQARLLAGQNAVIEKVEAPKATRTRKPKEDAAPEPETVKPATEEPAATGSGADDAASASDVAAPTPPTGDELKAFALKILGEKKAKAEKNDAHKDAYLTFGKFVSAAIPEEFNGAKVAEISDVDDRRRAHFYLRRAAADLPVDFKADYDFDGDPEQGAKAAGDDDFDV